MRTCSTCGRTVPDDANWCPHCGAKLSDEPAEPTPGAADAPPAPAESQTQPQPPSTGGWGWTPNPATPPAAFDDPAAPAHEGPDDVPDPDTAAEAPAAGERVGEGALRFSHSGETYILGYGPDFFGIWDRTKAGGPIVRFPRSDVGWNEAWNRFSGMEKRFVEVPQTGTPPDVRSGSTADFRPVGRLGTALVWLLVASGAMAVITMILRGVEITRLQDFRSGITSAQSVEDARSAANGGYAVAVLVIVATVIVWLIWHHRAQSNLRPLGVQDLRFTPGWVIAWWLIPFANFVMPPQVTAETWRASEPNASGGVEWKRRRLSPVFVVWWAAWLARIPFTSLASAAAPQSGGTVEQLIRQRGYGIASDAATLVAALAAVFIVRRITRWQEEKRDRMAAYGHAASAAVGS